MNGILPPAWAGRTMSLMRFVFGLLFFLHGTSKIMGWPSPMPWESLDWMSKFGVAAIIETVGGILIAVGFKTRIAAFIASGEMAVAYFMMHVPNGGIWPSNNGGEPVVLFCFAFLFFAAAGPGTIAIDKPQADPSAH
ncbi:MAG TPA: DoxX family protein [Gemmatimonadales bacterium]|nr:DoxX family protein [Gemmatimonadales bacterium]